MASAGDIVGGQYRLLEPIGEGGMATVWKAVHTTLECPLAIKRIHAPRGVDRADLIARFTSEARAAAAIRHRNVIDIVDFGTDECGDPFMVLEYLRGETLAARLEREPPLTLREIIHLASLSLSGLAAVHDAGIVHRDLKPDNIFLVEDADGWFPKLLDFGISKAVDPNRSGRLPTLDGVVLGTVQYMSPEQATGARDLDLRTDVFSAGIILYELLVGHRPFEAETFRRRITRLLTEDAKPLSAVRPELGDELSRVASRALARERDARFADARSMRDALMRAVQFVGPGVLDAPGARHGAPAATAAKPETQAPRTTVERPSVKRNAPAGEALSRSAQPRAKGSWFRTAFLLALLVAASIWAVELTLPGTLASARAQLLSAMRARQILGAPHDDASNGAEAIIEPGLETSVPARSLGGEPPRTRPDADAPQ